ncbi:MAG: reeler domain-containing protein [Pseudomarimonas sp.]
MLERNSLSAMRGLYAALLLAVSLLSAPSTGHAFSLGSPVCDVSSLPLVPMSPTLASPPPAGWRLTTARSIYVPGRALTVRVTHPSAEQSALGILIWAKRGFTTGAGAFLVDGGLYQHVPLPADCGPWAATHTSPVVKTQDELTFTWLPDASGEVIVRAFVIENCGKPGGCRGHQALTPIVVLRSVLFFDSFEDE